MDRATYTRIVNEAARGGRSFVATALALGWLDEAAYVRLLARHLRLVPITSVMDLAEVAIKVDEFDALVPAAHDVRIVRAGEVHRLVAAADFEPTELALLVARRANRGEKIALTTRALLAATIAEAADDKLKDAAVNALARRSPVASAQSRVWLWQAVALAVAAGCVVGYAAVAPAEALRLALLGLVLPFLAVVVVRLWALYQQIFHRRPTSEAARAPRLPDRDLPVYTVLVPLFREARVLPQIVRALAALDYPPAKLDIVIVLESIDVETQQVASRLSLPGNVRVLVVPDCAPRTKPKALNYALSFARGSHIVVFDAEDLPEPDQLRRAVDVFRSAPAQVACVQAALNVYNPQSGWLTRQFAIEYSVLFDALLPAYERLRIPVPLGGTSNHFPVSVLIELGGWDPFNVTEDADLGIRMARHGLETRMIGSTTWEEAPIRFGAWLKQRTRWIKGWMQTYLVHMRQPTRLHRDLGTWGFAGFQIVIGGIILSALVHPVAYVALAIEAWSGTLLQPSGGFANKVAWSLCLGTMIAGYVTAILTGAIAAAKRGRWSLVPSTLLMPFYWLLISLAAYRALYQLVRDPFKWEKTEHGHALGA